MRMRNVSGDTKRDEALLEAATAPLRRPRPVPAGFTEAVLRRIAQEGREPRSSRQPARSFPALSALAAAAALVIGVGLFLLRAPVRPTADVSPAAPQVQVELELQDVKAHTVAVAGDFNDWTNAAMRKGEDGVWRVRLSLPPGRYQYVFVVDGEKWIADPQASTVVDSGYSGANSVLDVSL